MGVAAFGVFYVIFWGLCCVIEGFGVFWVFWGFSGEFDDFGWVY